MRLSSHPANVAVALRSVEPNPIFREFGSAYAVERIDPPRYGHTLTSEGFLPQSLKRAAPRRAADFLAGRHCAASAMRTAGFGSPTVGIGHDGSPIWPSGVVGSITHAGLSAFALVAQSDAYLSIGIDCEEIVAESVAEEIRSTVLSSGELQKLSGDTSSRLDWPTVTTVVFSAKESIYKCLRPLADDFFEFHDVQMIGADFARGLLLFEIVRDLGKGVQRGMKLQSRFSLDGRRAYSLTVLNRSTRSPA